MISEAPKRSMIFIREVWADQFEALGSLSENVHFENGFLDTVVSGAQVIFMIISRYAKLHVASYELSVVSCEF